MDVAKLRYSVFDDFSDCFFIDFFEWRKVDRPLCSRRGRVFAFDVPTRLFPRISWYTVGNRESVMRKSMSLLLYGYLNIFVVVRNRIQWVQ